MALSGGGDSLALLHLDFRAGRVGWDVLCWPSPSITDCNPDSARWTAEAGAKGAERSARTGVRSCGRGRSQQRASPPPLETRATPCWPKRHEDAGARVLLMGHTLKRHRRGGDHARHRLAGSRDACANGTPSPVWPEGTRCFPAPTTCLQHPAGRPCAMTFSTRVKRNLARRPRQPRPSPATREGAASRWNRRMIAGRSPSLI